MDRSVFGALGLVAALVGGTAWGQVVERERDVSVTGPAGRTLERRVRSVREPGTLSREVEIHRPGGTFRRDVQVQRGGWGPGAHGPWGGGVVVEHGFGFGLAAPVFGFAFGPPPPPPVFLVPPPPVVVAPGPPVFVEAPPAKPFDPFADAMGRLRSRHDNSRRDGARSLGQIGDPRAVPALVDLLQMDGDREVRSAAAYALGAIGDSRARTPLEFAALNDRRREVRQAAAQAYAQIPRDAPEAVVIDDPAAGFADDLVPDSEGPPPPPDAAYRTAP